MVINLIIKSKNKKSIFYLLHVINKFTKNEKIKILSKALKTKRFTVLKSPHVNKTAQEQFESNSFLLNIQINSFDILKFLIMIKNIQNNFCYDILVKIKFKIRNQKIKKYFFISKIKKFNIKQLILNLNCYGKIYNQMSARSSLVDRGVR